MVIFFNHGYFLNLKGPFLPVSSLFSSSSVCLSVRAMERARDSLMSLWRGSHSQNNGAGAGGAEAVVEHQVDFWIDPERTGWLMKQGEYIKTWRRRWFVLKSGKLFWFKENHVLRSSKPRGIIPVASCLSVKGAEDTINKQFSFELTAHGRETMYFIADSEKEKEDWINAVGRSIVQHSRSVTESEVVDY